MDHIADLLQPYRDTIGTITALVTCAQMLSTIYLLNFIRRRGQTLPSDTIVPYCGGLVISTIGLRAGAAIADDTTIRTNLFGVAVHIMYLAFFYWYTPDTQRQSAWTRIGTCGAICATVLAYAGWEDEALVADRLFLLMFAIVFTLVAMPFLGLVSVTSKHFH